MTEAFMCIFDYLYVSNVHYSHRSIQCLSGSILILSKCLNMVETSWRHRWSLIVIFWKIRRGNCWINNSPLGQSLSPATMFPLDRPVENTSLLRRHLEELSIKFNCSNNGTCHIDSFKRNMSYWVIQKLYFLISSCCSRFLSEYWELTSHMKFM